MQPDLEDVIRARYEVLRRAAYVLTGDVHAADDLVQSTLVKVVRHWRQVQLAGDIDAYLFTILMRTHRTSLRRRWKGEVPTDVIPERESPDDVLAVLDRAELRAALQKLGRHHREVLVLRFMADWSEAQCAVLLGCSVGTVKSRTSRALTAIRLSTHADPAISRETT